MRPFLTAVKLFQGISEAEAPRIAGFCSERRYPQGATIFSEGDPSDSVYILKRGLVKLIFLSAKGTPPYPVYPLRADTLQPLQPRLTGKPLARRRRTREHPRAWQLTAGDAGG